MKNKSDVSKLSVSAAIGALANIADPPMGALPTVHEALSVTHTTKQLKDKSPLESENTKSYYASFSKILNVVLHYLDDFYKKESSQHVEPQTIEGVKTIMTLVADAAKKIDTYLSYDQPAQVKSVTELREYKKLQDFYVKKVVKNIDEKVLSSWIFGIAERAAKRRQESIAFAENHSSQYLFVDLDALKQDLEYELLFIRKENGSHFFSPRLIRNMKLVCNFSTHAHDKDPLLEIKRWQDRSMNMMAKNILRQERTLIDRFYTDAYRFRHREVVAGTSNCIMALMLCSNVENIRDLSTQKSCRKYFHDFHYFLSQLLSTADYHHLLAYPPKEGNKVNKSSMDLIHSFCHALFTDATLFDSLFREFQNIFNLNSKSNGAGTLTMAEHLKSDYQKVQNLLSHHPSGPLRKLLESFEHELNTTFNPLLQNNFSGLLYAIAIGAHKSGNLHLPAPTHQEYIHRASVLDEFKGMLYSYAEDGSKHLLIGLQDRSSWKEHARAQALEELALHRDFEKTLTVVSLPKDTDFYHQLPPYDQNNHFSTFIEQFKQHFGDEKSGYHLPPAIEIHLLSKFLDSACSAIHRIFFSSKNTLLKNERTRFIEIFDVFLILKLIDLVKPTTFSLTCKDGIDIGSSNSALLYMFLKMIAPTPMEMHDWDNVNKILYVPAIYVRERAISRERFDTMVATIDTFETVYREVGHETFRLLMKEAFRTLYSEDFWNATIMPSISR